MVHTQRNQLKIIYFLYCLIFLFIIRVPAYSQNPEIDSLSRLLATPKNDTVTANRYISLSILYSSVDVDSAMLLATKGMELSDALDYEPGEAKSMYCMGMAVSYTGNDAYALELYLSALKMLEEQKDKIWIAKCQIEISGLYSDLNDYRNALEYAQRAYQLSKLIPALKQQFEAAYNIAYSYIKLKKPDSALYYFQESYQLANDKRISNKSMLGQAFGGLGLVQSSLGNTDLARPYLYKGIQYASESFDLYNLLFNYDFLANVFLKEQKNDSAIYYFDKALTIADKLRYEKEKLDIYRPLAMLYEKTNPAKSIEYYKLEAMLRDSLADENMHWDIQNLTFRETQRQRALQEQKIEEAKQRDIYMQYAGIVIALILLIICVLLLSRSIIVHEKVIEFLGVFALLIFFEFFNLLLHPFLENVTHHSPLLMLLGLIIVAAVIIPIHHKLDHLIRSKLVEKNKNIRLMAAKKTIERLEKKPEQEKPAAD